MDIVEHGHEMGSLSFDAPSYEFKFGVKFHSGVAPLYGLQLQPEPQHLVLIALRTQPDR